MKCYNFTFTHEYLHYDCAISKSALAVRIITLKCEEKQINEMFMSSTIHSLVDS